MKILIFSNNGGGLYKFRKELIEDLLKNHCVSIALPYDEFADPLKDMGCSFYSTEFDRHGKNPLKEFGLIRLYKRIINQVKPDVVLNYTIKPNIYAGSVCASRGIPYIANITGLGGAIENGGMISKISLQLYKYGLRGAQVVFFQNEKNMEFMKKNGIVHVKSDLLPGSGVNLSEHCFEDYPPDDDELIFNVIGRIMKDKGIDEVLEMAEKLSALKQKVRIRLIGDYDEDYSSRIEEAEAEGWIEYCGFQKVIHNFIRDSHATIHASYHEGMSNVLLESAATGRPVIASRISGCIETFDEGISGLGFEPRNSESLTQAVIRFIELPHDKKAEMGMAGRNKMEREFDRAQILARYKEELELIQGEKSDSI